MPYIALQCGTELVEKNFFKGKGEQGIWLFLLQISAEHQLCVPHNPRGEVEREEKNTGSDLKEFNK